MALGIDRPLYRVNADGGIARLACAVIGFVQQLEQMIDVGRDLARVAGGA
jgi:hypothetical protein